MTRRDTMFDALAVAVAVLLVVVSVLGPPANAAYSPAGIAVECGTLVLLPFRRRAPLTVGWVVATVALVMAVVELRAPGTFARTELTPWVPLATTPFAAYSALAGDKRLGWAPVVVLAVVAARPWEPVGPVVTQGLLLTAAPALVGLYVAARRRLVEQALADQRAQLAADMHDTVTHRMSLIILRAGVLGMSAPDEATRAAAEELRATGCQALEELQELVHVLYRGAARVPANDWAPAPEIAPLVRESTSAGVHTELVENGDPGTVSPVIRRTAHRVVQEALTNVRKHAPGADAHVHVRYANGMHLTVRNTRASHDTDPALTRTGSGAGLDNLRQRVEMVGGTLTAGPATNGGFRVTATLPAVVP